MRKKRTYYTSDEKVNIIRKHLLERVPISDLCEKYKLQPIVFYRWQKQFFENGARSFDGERKHNNRSHEEKILTLEQKLQTKNEVLSELMEEHLKLKKNFGEV
jgi:transposase-like protein